jgi:hypothetical protein
MDTIKDLELEIMTDLEVAMLDDKEKSTPVLLSKILYELIDIKTDLRILVDRLCKHY